MESSSVVASSAVEQTAVSQASVEQLLATAETQYHTVQQQLTELKKTLTSLRKAAAKSVKKQSSGPKKQKVENPKKVSDKLAAFMKLDKENQVATRTQATKAISAYTKEHSLQEGKNYKVDAFLSDLLGLEVGSLQSYISINGSLSQHFPK